MPECCGWPMNSVNVIGAGAWGTALAIHCARLGLEVCLWARRPEAIGAENPRLPGVALPTGVRVSGALTPADVSLLAVPMQHLRGVLTALCPGGTLVVCCKGIESGTLRLPLEVVAQVLPGSPALVLTGPNFAAEVASGLPAAAVLAGGEAWQREEVIGVSRASRAKALWQRGSSGPADRRGGEERDRCGRRCCDRRRAGRECPRRSDHARPRGNGAAGRDPGRSGGDGRGPVRPGRPGADLHRDAEPQFLAWPGARAAGRCCTR